MPFAPQAVPLGTPQAAPGFVVEDAIPGSHIEAPVALAFTPGGLLLVADVPGRVWVIDHGVQLPTPMWSAENEVEIDGDCGLLGMALSPEFAIDRRIFLLYSVDPDSNGVDDDSVHFGRLVRYQVSASDPTRIDPATRVVLMGASWHSGIPNASGTHDVGALRFGADGTLFVSAGEGSHWDRVDAGGQDPTLFLPGRSDPSMDRGAFRSQQLDCPAGKILRIDPLTGHGLPTNPFWNGDPDAVVSKIWAYGLRNPFRFTLRPGTGNEGGLPGRPGTLYVGDVGWEKWEELDVVPEGGLDFGWPCREGARACAPYAALTPAFGGCSGIGDVRDPVLAISHVSADSSAPFAVRGNCIVPGAFLVNSAFPEPWQGRLIIGDFYRGWMYGVRFDAFQHFVDATPLATGMNGPVDSVVDPATGDLVVACIGDDHVRRIRWAPAASVTPNAASLRLSEAAPLPSRGSVTLTLTLPSPARVTFEICDLAGRRVWAAPATNVAAGERLLAWDGRDAQGRALPAGLYLARVSAGDERLTRRIVVVR
jgi:glucose/arabinose dehydrogenase